MPEVSAAWLALTPEEALEPELPICDPHHHLWDREGYRYLIHELLDDLQGGHNIVSTVFVECFSMFRADGPEAMKPVGETEFVNGVAAMSASGGYGPARLCEGIIGFADLLLGAEVAPVLEAHRAAAPARFRGIRHAAGWHPSGAVRNSHTRPFEKMMLESKFREGFARLHHYDLVFDAWCYFTQLDEFADLASHFPETTIILDHVGGPIGIGPYEGKREEVYEAWKMGIDKAAACDNVFVKLGGLAMPVINFGWHKQDKPPGSEEIARGIAPYITYCIERFGPERCMFESNFPVDKASCSYTTLWNAFKRTVKDYSASEKAALFHDTAARAYRLPSA